MYFLVRVNPKEIDFLNKIIEGYDGLGWVTTVDPLLGLLKINVTPDTKDEVGEILRGFPVHIAVEDLVEEC